MATTTFSKPVDDEITSLNNSIASRTRVISITEKTYYALPVRFPVRIGRALYPINVKDSGGSGHYFHFDITINNNYSYTVNVAKLDNATYTNYTISID